MELSSPKKDLMKLFYTLNKTPLEEIGCLSNLLLLTGCSSIQIFNSFPFPEHSQSGHFWYPTTHCAVLA